MRLKASHGRCKHHIYAFQTAIMQPVRRFKLGRGSLPMTYARTAQNRLYTATTQKRQSANEERMLTAFIYCMNICSLFSALGESISPKYWMESHASLWLSTYTLPH